jgi:hypothetical protein
MIDEHNVREMLHRRANAVPTPVVDVPKAARRARRRLLANGAVAMLVAGAIAVAALAGIDEIRDASVPAGQPTPSPVIPPPTPFTERFDSPLNGLSIGYPSGWRTRAATAPWGHGEVAFDAPDVDVIFDPTFRDDLYIAVVSEPLGDTSGSDWGNDMWRNLESVGICTRAFGGGGGHAGSGGGSADTVHGNDAWYEHCGTPVGSDDVVIVATATRGYIIDLHVADDRLLQATYGPDADWFEAALETVDLRPEGAVDTLNPSESPLAGGAARP